MSSQQAPSDAELAILVRAGDTAALGQLYDRHVRGIHDFLARFTRDPAAAEDLAHSTFLRAWERRETLRDPSRVRAWLYATAHNLALNHVTRAHPAGSMDDEAAGRIADPAPGPEAEAIAADAADLVWAAASSLEARQYAVLDLSVRQGLSTREIADVLGVPVGHAAVLVNRAREALGNAVRYLLVARRRDHCERLAALVPAGVRALTAQQRSAVDHHMRRCESCQALGRRLTAPAELLGALLPLALPASLGDGGRERLVAAVRAAPGGSSPGQPSWPPRRRPWEGRGRWAAGLAALLLLLTLGGGAGVYALRTPPALASRAGPDGSIGAAETPAPSPEQATESPTAAATPSPGPSPSPMLPVAPVGSPTTRPSASPSTSPTPTPPAPLGVVGITVASLDRGTCQVPAGAQIFICSFTVKIDVVNATGSEVIDVTLTATAKSGEVGTAQFQVKAGSPSADVTVRFLRCPQGTASATTRPPSAKPSNDEPFGAC